MSGCETVPAWCVPEDSAFVILRRLEVDGANTGVQSAVAAISWAAFPWLGGAAVASGSLSPAAVLFDALQTDGRWKLDAVGYNFRHELPATVFDTPGTYRIEHRVTTTAGAEFFLAPFKIEVLPFHTS
jgi:hypothetical protein